MAVKHDNKEADRLLSDLNKAISKVLKKHLSGEFFVDSFTFDSGEHPGWLIGREITLEIRERIETS